MPIYSYKCEKCGRILEEIQKFSDDPYKNCDEVDLEDECPGGGTIARQRTIPAKPILKGGGWAADGYGSNLGGLRPDDGSLEQGPHGSNDRDFGKVIEKTKDQLIQHAKDHDAGDAS